MLIYSDFIVWPIAELLSFNNRNSNLLFSDTNKMQI